MFKKAAKSFGAGLQSQWLFYFRVFFLFRLNFPESFILRKFHECQFGVRPQFSAVCADNCGRRWKYFRFFSLLRCLIFSCCRRLLRKVCRVTPSYVLVCTGYFYGPISSHVRDMWHVCATPTAADAHSCSMYFGLVT